VLALLSIWFDDPQRLTTGLGLFSAGLAFALQRVVTALAGYVVIMRGNTFTVGDRITMGGVRGDVIALTFTQTKIMEMGQPPAVQGADPAMWVRSRQFTGRIVTVTNDKVFDEPVYNYTREFPFVWEEMMVAIPYRADRVRAESILLACVAEHAEPLDRQSQRGSACPRTAILHHPRRSHAEGVLPPHAQLTRTDGAIHRARSRNPPREGGDRPCGTPQVRGGFNRSGARIFGACWLENEHSG
jgi:small-conductance mechanosensitive channel